MPSKRNSLRRAVKQSRTKSRLAASQMLRADGPFDPNGTGAVGFPKFHYSLFPNTMRQPMSYTERAVLTAATSSLWGTAKRYRLNSIYDPDFTGIGTYPYGYSAISAIYANYRVMAVTIDVTVSEPSADGCLFAANLCPSNAFTTIAGLDIGTVDKKNTSDVRQLNNTGYQITRVIKKFRIADLEGLPENQFIANPNYSAGIGGNPSATPWLEICAAAYNGTPTIDCLVRLTFDVEFFGRIQQ
jgi:hypothetical protein